MIRLILVFSFFAIFAVFPKDLFACDAWSFRRSLNEKSYGYVSKVDSENQRIEEFTIKPGDCSRNATWDDCKNHRERSEVIEAGTGTPTNQNQPLWYRWSFLYPSENQLIWPVKIAVGQFHQLEGGPLWMMQVGEKSLIWEHIPSGKQFLLADLQSIFDQWIDIKIQVLWRSDISGFLKLWINGQQKVEYKGATSQASSVFFKYGIYRSFLDRATKEQKMPDRQSVIFSSVCKTRNENQLSLPKQAKDP